MLIWVVIFNHKAESPTFIIAVTGAAIWYFSNKPRIANNTLLIFLFLVTCLSFSDLVPHDIRQNIIKPYAIKAVPCIVIWCLLFLKLITMHSQQDVSGNSVAALPLH